jgi:hypothetical protein
LGLALALAVLFAAAVLMLAVRGQARETVGVPARAMLVAGWLLGLPIAMWYSADRSQSEAREGFLDLARLYGLEPDRLALSRALAAAWCTAKLVLIVSVPCSVLSLIAAPSVAGALHRALALLIVPLFAACAGALLSGLAAVCSTISPRHGRSVFLALLFIPWALQGVLSPARVSAGSISGVLSSLAHLMASVAGGPR